MEIIGSAGGEDLMTIPDRARRQEEEGFDVLSTGDTNRDAFLMHSLAALTTTRIKLGTSVAAAFGRSPYVSAMLAWDLQRMSRGRFELGLGCQVRRHVEKRLSAEWYPPGPRLRDYIGCIRAIWESWQTGETPSYVGKYYTYAWSNPTFDPGPIDYERPKILISAVNDYTCRLAGELCDGILLHPLSTSQYVRNFVMPRLEEGARKGSRSLKDFIISGGSFMGIGRDEDELIEERNRIRSTIGFYGSTGAYRVIFESHGWGETAKRLHALSLERRWDEMTQLITDEMVDTVGLVTTPSGMADAIRERWGGLLNRVGLGLSGASFGRLTAGERGDLIKKVHEIS